MQYGSAPRNRLDLYLPSGCEFDEEKTEAAVRAADAEADAHPAAPNGHAGRDPATERLLHGTNGAGAAGQSGQSMQTAAGRLSCS